MRFIVLSFLFCALAQVAGAEIVLGPEVALSAPSMTSAPYAQRISSVASNGHDFLALWSDDRNILDSTAPRRLSALYAGRVDASGHPLNPTGTKLFDAASGRLAWTGTSYLLAYTLPNGHSFVQELDVDGNLTGTAKELLIGGPAVAMATNGRNILLVHTATMSGANVSLLSRDGTLLTRELIGPLEPVPQPFVLPGGDYAFTPIRTVCPGNVGCFRTVSFLTVSATDGKVTEKALFDTTYWAQANASASNDGRILVVAQQDSQGARTASYEVIRRDGSVVAPMTSLETGIPRSLSGIARPSVGWDGREFLVILQWPEESEWMMSLHGFRVAPDGARLDSAPLIFHTNANGWNEQPLFASSAAGQLVAYGAYGPSDYDLFVRAARNFEDIAAVPEQSITFSAALQRFPKLTSGPGPLTIWVEGFESLSIHAALIGSPDSTALTSTDRLAAPAVMARGKSAYLIAWRVGGPLRILARRVSFDGKPIGDPFLIASEEDAYTFPFPSASVPQLSVAFDGVNFLVAWLGDDEVHAARVSDDGSILDKSPLVVSNPILYPEVPITPRVVASDNGFLVAWIQLRFCGCLISPQPPPTSKLFVSRVDKSGIVTRLNATWNRGSTDQLLLTRVSNGKNMAIWRDSNDTPSQICLERIFLNEDGTPASGIAQLTCAAYLTGSLFADLDAEWDGTALTLAWQDAANQIVVAQRFNPMTPAALDAPLQVNPEGTRAAAPSIAVSGNRTFVAYQRIADVSRVFVRTLDVAPANPRKRAAR